MAMQKKYDLVIKTGEYEKDGVTKGRYQNVGACLQDSEGKMCLVLEPWFNPAGAMREGKVWVNMFDPNQ